MQKKVLFVIITLLSFIVLVSSDSEVEKNSSFVFTNVNVIPMDREVILTNYDVIVKNGQIKELGPSSSLDLPKEAEVINAAGKFMIPALSDMHVHLEGEAWNIMYPPKGKFSKEEIKYKDILFIYIANGITMIDVMSAFPEHIELKASINDNELLGPRLILSRLIDGPGKAWPEPISTWVGNSVEAKQAVIEAHIKGYDRIKAYSFLDKSSYDTIIATADSLQMPVDGHIPISTSVEYIIESGQNMIAHVEEIMKFTKKYNSEQISYYATLIAKSDIWVTSTLITSHNLIELLENDQQALSKKGTEYLHPMGADLQTFINDKLYQPIPEEQRVAIKNRYHIFQKPFIKEYQKKGGKILAGTDALIATTLPGFALHKELKELVNAGMSPFEALQTATINPYAFIGELNMGGTIEPGKNANLVLLDENPLENISNTKKIFGIMTQNKWISKTEIDNRLDAIITSYTKLRNEKSK
jgi:imidazolonepropionase-like amidohydrolase